MISVEIRINGKLVSRVDCCREGSPVAFGQPAKYSITAFEIPGERAEEHRVTRSVELKRWKSPFRFLRDLFAEISDPPP